MHLLVRCKAGPQTARKMPTPLGHHGFSAACARQALSTGAAGLQGRCQAAWPGTGIREGGQRPCLPQLPAAAQLRQSIAPRQSPVTSGDVIAQWL